MITLHLQPLMILRDEKTLRNIYAYSEKRLQHRSTLGKVSVLNFINFQTKNLILNNLVDEMF